MSAGPDEEGNLMRGCLVQIVLSIACWAGGIYLILWLVREFSR